MSDGKVTENVLKTTQTKRTRGTLDDPRNIDKNDDCSFLDGSLPLRERRLEEPPTPLKSNMQLKKHMELRERPKECSKPNK